MMDRIHTVIEQMPDVGVRIKETIDVHVSGVRLSIISCAAVLSTFALLTIANGIYVNNELKQRELNIRQKELELQQRQFALDSIRYYGVGKIKQK